MNTPYLPWLDIAPPTLVEHFEYWRHCNNGELRFQRCVDCGTWQHPPSPTCANCRSFQLRWEPVPTQNPYLFSYTVVYHAASPALKERVPYNVAIVAFEGMGDLRLVSNVVDAQPAEMGIGMPLELVWQVDGERRLPLFRKRPAA